MTILPIREDGGIDKSRVYLALLDFMNNARNTSNSGIADMLLDIIIDQNRQTIERCAKVADESPGPIPYRHNQIAIYAYQDGRKSTASDIRKLEP